MHTLIYDGSLPGLFTAIFEVYEYHYTEAEIISRQNFSPSFFTEIQDVTTTQNKANRVLKRIEKQLGKFGVKQLFETYLSDLNTKEQIILNVVRYAIDNPRKNVLRDYANPDVLALTKLSKSVSKEAHRFKGFVRFEKLKDDVFFAKIAPDYNILPLLKNHFSSRFKDQLWLIYDTRRQYGMMYDLNNIEFIYPTNFDLELSNKTLWNDDEGMYQKLWQQYFQKTDISERKNTKLQLQYMPKRYWKYLTEQLG